MLWNPTQRLSNTGETLMSQNSDVVLRGHNHVGVSWGACGEVVLFNPKLKPMCACVCFVSLHAYERKYMH